MTTTISTNVIELAKEWVMNDPNPVTANYVQKLIDNNDTLLKKLFPIDGSRIQFGTAGLRSTMQVGPLHMNDLVVVQAAQGIAKYCEQTLLIEQEQEQSTSEQEQDHVDKKQKVTNDNDNNSKKKKLRVIIGYDHRQNEELNISSKQFAIITALVFEQMKDIYDIILLDGYMATPIVPFTIRHYNEIFNNNDSSISSSNNNDSNNNSNNRINNVVATIGIQITASHNPKDDAGYKIYWIDGCQIRNPIDIGIAKYIQDNLQPWCNYRTLLTNYLQHNDNNNEDEDNKKKKDSNIYRKNWFHKENTQKIIQAYFNAIANSTLYTKQSTKLDFTNSTSKQKSPPTFIYTAMHGVGYKFAKHIFNAFKLPMFHSVGIQQEPDANFSTVSFPNPEERGSLELAKMYAITKHANIILANDPDADRLAVAEYNGNNNDDDDNNNGDDKWTVFTGDQIGVLLGYWLWTIHKDDTTIVPAMFASTVSSIMLSEIAKIEGFYFEDTLTGFKWIGSRAAQLHNTTVPDSNGNKKYCSIFGYEEAIGFCCGNIIFDKDGICALGIFAELSYYIYYQGQTIKQFLQTLYDKYGEFVSNNGYYIMKDNTVVSKIMNKITNNGKFDTLDNVGPYRVKSIRYLGEPGYDSTTIDNKPILPCSISSPMITICFSNDCVVQFRASGTEPKFKYYIELKGQPGKSKQLVEKELKEMSTIILDILLEPEKNGLERT